MLTIEGPPLMQMLARVGIERRTCSPFAPYAVTIRLDVECLDQRRGASVVQTPLHDPEGGRMRG